MIEEISKYEGLSYLAARRSFFNLERAYCLRGAAYVVAAGVCSTVDMVSCVGLAAIELGKAVGAALFQSCAASGGKFRSGCNYLGRAAEFAAYTCYTPVCLLDPPFAHEEMRILLHHRLSRTVPFAPRSDLLDLLSQTLPFVARLEAESELPCVGELYGTVALSNHPQYTQKIFSFELPIILFPLALAVDGFVYLVFFGGQVIGESIRFAAVLTLAVPVLITLLASRFFFALGRLGAGEEVERIDESCKNPISELELEVRLDVWVANSSFTGEKAEAKARVLRALREKLTRLDLSSLGLNGLPPFIPLLTQLRELQIHGNLDLSEIPADLSQIPELTCLSTEGTAISRESLYSWLEARLEAWVADSSCTGRKTEAKKRILHAFRESSTNLSLTVLFLSRLPSCIGQLTQLRQLSLYFNQLEILPPEIGRLTGLEKLDLSCNKLATLPPEIGRLTGLEDFDLSRNKLTTLPSEIGRLTGLEGFDLRNNELTTLLPEIGELTQLRFLRLSHNQLKALPPEIGRLRSLLLLDVKNNPDLSALPIAMGQMFRLILLEIEGTAISPVMHRVILTATRRLLRARIRATLAERLPLWREASRGEFDLSGLSNFSREEREILNMWLRRLERTREFGGGAQVVMAHAVCGMLAEATTNAAFRAALLGQVAVNNENCGDRASMALNEIYTLWGLTTLNANAPITEQLALLVQAAKSVALRSAVARKIDAQQEREGWIELEAVEIYLYCEIELRERLGLLSVISTMAYQGIGNVEWINLDDLANEVNRTYLAHLITLSAFVRIAEERGEYRRGHEEEYALLSDQLEEVRTGNLPEGEKLVRMKEIQQQREQLDLQHKKEWALALLAR